VLLSIGRLVREKNYPMLFEVVCRLRPRHPRLRVVIAGWGAAEASLREQRNALGLADDVELLGRREDVGDLLSAADVFVMPSLSEGFSNALLEAMWAGMPVVSTRVNGAVEVIRHEHNGLLTDVGDKDSFANAIHRLLSDDALRQRLSDNARREVRDRFSLEAMVAAHVEVYEKVAARWRPR
jgi:glycosyltransferase involved in cell wall biosynthesis